MRLSVTFALITLLSTGKPTLAQLKDMLSQAEFDPILQNAGKKLQDFVATLTEFRIEAAALDGERLDDDLKSVKQLQAMIHVTQMGSRESKGIDMKRLEAILTGLDDMALDAATWKSLAELQVCQDVQHQNLTRHTSFAVRVAMNSEMLREVGRQLFHPTFRMASAFDELLLTLTNAASDNEKQTH